MAWFGKLDLAYKFSLVFGCLVVLTISAGCVKVLYDRRKLRKHTKAAENVEAGPQEDQLELNQREKDEGDLFGIRAIEAGFYAGIPQSRPTSAASSFVEKDTYSNSMGTSTLVGRVSSILKDQTNSTASSVTSLPPAHVNGNSDSDTALSNSPPRKISPRASRLRPSEAELSGRINHNAAVNMNSTVPPSPVTSQPPRSPANGGSDSGDDEQCSPRSLSPRSANFNPDYSASRPPQSPMSFYTPEPQPSSQINPSSDPFSGSVAHIPEAKRPTMPRG